MYLNALLTTSLDFLIRFIHFDSSAVQIKRGRGWDVILGEYMGMRS